jgi:hypothetical protein
MNQCFMMGIGFPHGGNWIWTGFQDGQDLQEREQDVGDYKQAKTTAWQPQLRGVI